MNLSDCKAAREQMNTAGKPSTASFQDLGHILGTHYTLGLTVGTSQ